jgi:phosphotriesterase-related protein
VKPLFEASKFAPRLTRRKFLRDATLLSVGAATGAHAAREAAESFVQTVLGPIPASKLGVTLVHEHVMCDFIGAE